MTDEELMVDLLPLDRRGEQRVGAGCFLIRVTHLPTGMSVTVPDKRGQHRAREYAITMLGLMVEDFA